VTVTLTAHVRSDSTPAHDRWVAQTARTLPLEPERRFEPSAELDDAFAAIVPDLLALTRTLGRNPTAILAHAPSATVVASDLGETMAWVRLVEGWAATTERWLVICDDPWLFRQLAAIPGVSIAGAPPRLWPRRLSLALRGWAARTAFALRTCRAALAAGKPVTTPGGGWLLSYGQQTAAGDDAYFGSLRSDLPELRLLLHVDCAADRAVRFGGLSLHGFGSPLAALSRLPFARWRPGAADVSGPWGWLVRRVAALEGATAQGAAIRWQILCQRAWLAAVRPAVVAWPWECHGWERDLARAARVTATRTVGVQHSTIGRFELNHHVGAHAEGLEALPDHILCVGALFRRHLEEWGVPAARLRVAGALRYAAAGGPRLDPMAPVFVALPSHLRIARQMVAAVTRAAAVTGRHFVLRDHPMYPLDFAEDERVRRADGGLASQQAVSAVLYAATTVGLEAVLLGLPTLRFVPRGCVALNILPNNVVIPAVDDGGLVAALDHMEPPPSLGRTDVFAPVDLAVWREALNPKPMPECP
jgi:hypothetical protein